MQQLMQKREQQQAMLNQQQQLALRQQATQRAMEIGPPEIVSNDVALEQQIGKGSFGKVFRGRCRQKEVAVKKLNKVNFDNKTLLTFKREVRIMSRIFHPNVCLFMGACLEQGNCMIVTELLPRGDLETLLHNEKIPLTDYQKMKMAHGAALGMCWLHCSDPVFIHRDLKSSNLLLDNNLNVKVCDFGLSQLIPRDKKIKDTQNAKGTPLWMAPEVMQFREFNEKCDVYSFGIVLWEIVTRKEPYAEFNSFDKFKHAVCVLHVRPEIPDTVAESVASLMRDCWQPEAALRPGFIEICQRLAAVVLEEAIPQDPTAAEWWVQNFGSSEDADRDEFTAKLSAFVLNKSNNAASAADSAESSDANMADASDTAESSASASAASGSLVPAVSSNAELPELDRRCLNALLDEISDGDMSGEPKVSLVNFGRLIGWFGPFDEFLVDRIRETLRKVWFHGMISTPDAQMRLGGLPNGSFLVRLSTTHAGCFTISSLSRRDGTLRHQRVLYKRDRLGGGKFHYNSHEFDALDGAIIDAGYYPPAPGAKFQALFVEGGNAIVGYLES